jgi:DNA-binding transcriptional ArsR family regulator
LLNRSVEFIFNYMVDNNQIRQECSSDELDRTFGALSDPSRRQIIELLRESGDLKVTDVAEVFSMSLNGVSKHIKVLERAGLVVRRIDGREHWLGINWARLQPAYEWLHFYRHFWNARFDALVDYVQLNTEKKGKDNE